MDRFFGIVEKWPNPLGQGVFLLIVASMALYSSTCSIVLPACCSGKHPSLRSTVEYIAGTIPLMEGLL